MKVFISSVRRGLEEERDCLPGLIRALGHEPLRFEDFSAQAVPGREACLRGVDECAVYLLLLGPHYGHVFPDTGQSPTHDEFVAARNAGKPFLVFRKEGIDIEPEQQTLIRQIGDYGTGAFYDTFTSAVDLQPKVAQALAAVMNAPGTLTYERLPGDVSVVYRPSEPGQFGGAQAAVEVHVVPLEDNRRSARLMSLLPEQIASGLRNNRAIPAAAGVETSSTSGSVTVSLAGVERRRHDEPNPSALQAVSVRQTGQVTVRHSLPRDQMGTILDPEDLTTTIASSLRLAGGLGLLTGDRLAVAVDITDPSNVSEGVANGINRNRSFGLGSRGQVRVHPDESVSAVALSRGADEVARPLVNLLMDAFRSQR